MAKPTPVSSSPSSAQPKRSKRKRPVASPREQRGEQGDEEEEGPSQKKLHSSPVWKNLDLVLSLQNKDLSPQSKVGLAFDFVGAEADGEEQSSEPLRIYQLASFLGEWMQHFMISSENGKKSLELSETCLDGRCWVILKFCLERSSFKVSANFLRTVTSVLRHALSWLEGDGLMDKGDPMKLFGAVYECLSLIFVSHGKLLKTASVELWISCAVAAVRVNNRISSDIKFQFSSSDVLPRLLCLILEQFATFLRFHPSPRNIFRPFVDRLLELLLESLDFLHQRMQASGGELESKLLGAVEDVLSNGLFHPSHMNGFLRLKGSDLKTEEDVARVFNESYHRHLFQKVRRIIAEKKGLAMSGFGDLFSLLVCKAKKIRGNHALHKSSRAVENTKGTSEEVQETSQPLFEVFVHFVEPLLLACKKFIDLDIHEVGKTQLSVISETHCVVVSINGILAKFMHEKIYSRMKDTTEGANYSFLKVIYATIISISKKMYQLWPSKVDAIESQFAKLLNFMAGELVIAIGYFLEIEYKIVGDDLVVVWLIMLSNLAIHTDSMESKNDPVMIPNVLHIGCEVIKLYSELRQVDGPIFALCEAVRIFFSGYNKEDDTASFLSSRFLSSQTCSKAVATLLLSQELRDATSIAMKLIPEGQTSTFIEHLKLDVGRSLEWIKGCLVGADRKTISERTFLNSNLLDFGLQVELFGTLSEPYAIMLESLTVNTSNSNSVGAAIEDLITSLLPAFATLTENQADDIERFFIFVTGRRLSDPKSQSELHYAHVDTSLILMFFFRIYISCRSIYHQVISLMPRNARKAAAAMGSMFTACQGEDWIGKIEWTLGSYFAWVNAPSCSLSAVIENSSGRLSDSLTSQAPFVYILHTMALQRLIDLNRQIKGIEFLQESEGLFSQIYAKDDAVYSVHTKKKKWKQLIKVSKQEMADLTSFITQYLSSTGSRSKFTSSWRDLPINPDAWDFGLCSLNEKSLPIAVWWLLCKNIDVWCAHATRKVIKKFISLVICQALPITQNSISTGGIKKKAETCQGCETNMHQISLELLMDTLFYEQTVLSRHLTSRLLRTLEDSLLPVLSHASGKNVDLSLLPSWGETLSVLEKGFSTCKSTWHASVSSTSLMGSDDGQSDFCHLRDDSGQTSFCRELSTCQNLLNLICQIIKVNVNSRSIKRFATYILNLERLLVLNLLGCCDSFLFNQFELLKLFASCRRVLRYLAAASFEENLIVHQSPLAKVLCEDPLSISWLLESVSVIIAVPRQYLVGEYHHEIKQILFLVMDHTANFFSMMSQGLLIGALPFLRNDQVPFVELPECNKLSGNKTTEMSSNSYSSICLDVWKQFELVSESLKKHTQELKISMGHMHDVNFEFDDGAVDWNSLAHMISSLQGFLWGVSSVLNIKHENISVDSMPKCMLSCFSKLHNYIYTFEDFVDSCLTKLLVNGQGTDFLYNPSCCLDLSHELNLSNQKNLPDTEISSGNQFNYSMPLLVGDCESSPITSHAKTEKPSVSENSADNMLTAVHSLDLLKQQNLRGSLIKRLLNGELPSVAFLIRQLFISSAAILNLNYLPLPRDMRSRSSCSRKVPRSTNILVGTAYSVLLELTKMTGLPDSLSFLCLDGVLKYLEVVGRYVSFAEPVLSRNVYVNLIDVHLKAIGKCISLQGKAAALSSHETGSSTKMLQPETDSYENELSSLDIRQYGVNELKARLRMSFRKFIKTPSELHLLSAVQAIERALVGVQQDCNAIYEISTGSRNGGRVSLVAAAGIECFDLVLESVSGNRPLGVIRRHSQSLISSLFNIILHLQNPSIFFQWRLSDKVDPDPGAIVLMCVEVLTKVAGKNSFYQMDSCLVGQSLHLPMSLFHGFHQLNSSIQRHANKICPAIVDRRFSVDLYAACCRLLCTTLRHRKSETGRCIPLLEDAVYVLIACLETVNADLLSRKDYFAWETQEAVKCASFLRRVYEEIRQQRDLLMKYAAHFLSTYISVYSGLGPLRSGIKREVDEALRPGIYALVDICSPDDFQQLHTVLGEGPCRTTLANLQHDYKLNFQYEGKV